LETLGGYAECDTDESEDHRRQNVPKAAQDSDGKQLSHRPALSPPEDDKRQGVIDADQGVKETDSYRGAQEH